MRVSVDVALVTLTCVVLMGLRVMLEQLNLKTQALSVCVDVDAQLLYSGNNKWCGQKTFWWLLLSLVGLPQQLLGMLARVWNFMCY